MAQSAKAENPLMGSLERQLEMNSSAGMEYEIFGSKYDLFPRLKPEKIRKVDRITDEVWLWTFVDDKCGTWKNSVKCNKEMNSVTWTLLEGEVPEKLYEALKVEYQFSSNDQGCKAKAKLTYEKKDITVPRPNAYMEFIYELLVAAANNPLKH